MQPKKRLHTAFSASKKDHARGGLPPPLATEFRGRAAPGISSFPTPKGQARQAGRAMLKRLLDTVRKYPLLKLLLVFHG